MILLVLKYNIIYNIVSINIFGLLLTSPVPFLGSDGALIEEGRDWSIQHFADGMPFLISKQWFLRVSDVGPLNRKACRYIIFNIMYNTIRGMGARCALQQGVITSTTVKKQRKLLWTQYFPDANAVDEVWHLSEHGTLTNKLIAHYRSTG